MNRPYSDLIDYSLSSSTASVPMQQDTGVLPRETSEGVKPWLLSISIRLCQFLLGEAAVGLVQPQVQWQRDRQGHSFYQVYDPQSDSHRRFETAVETRIWLESRYNR